MSSVPEFDGIYIFKDPDPKRSGRDVSVTFYFADNIEVKDMVGEVLTRLENSFDDIEFSIDMITVRDEDDS